MQAAVELGEDVGQGFIKSLVFALVVTWIALFNGYDAKPNFGRDQPGYHADRGSLLVSGAGSRLYSDCGHVWVNMMKFNKIEFMVGCFMLAGILAGVLLSLKVAGLTFDDGRDSYTLFARFDNIGGLKVRSPVNQDRC